MFRPARRAVTNALTAVFSENPDPPFNLVFENRDFLPSLRNEIPELHDWAFAHRAELCDLILRIPPTNEESKLGSQAVRCFDWPSHTFVRRLKDDPVYVDKMRQFIGDGERFANPVLSGRFQAMFRALFWEDQEILKNPAFRGLPMQAIQALEISGWEDFIGTLISDSPQGIFFLLPELIQPFQYLAGRALRFALAKPPEFLRLGRIFSILVQVSREQASDSFAPIAGNLPFLRDLLNAVRIVAGGNPLETPDQRVVLIEGVSCAARMLKCAEYDAENNPELKKVLRFHRWTSRAAFRELGLGGLEWTSDGDFTDRHKLAIAIFPAFWPGGIEKMFPLLFAKPEVGLDVGRVILKVLKKWIQKKPERFLSYAKTHGLLKLLREHGIESRIGNPYPFRLAVLLTYGQYKTPVPDSSWQVPEPKRPVKVTKWVKEWEEHSEWARDVLYPRIIEMTKDWAEVKDKLKPRSEMY